MKVVFASRELHMTSVTPPMFVTVTVGGDCLTFSATGTIHP